MFRRDFLKFVTAVVGHKNPPSALLQREDPGLWENDHESQDVSRAWPLKPRDVGGEVSKGGEIELPFPLYASGNEAAKSEIIVTLNGMPITDFKVKADWKDGVGFDAVVNLPPRISGYVDIVGDREPRRLEPKLIKSNDRSILEALDGEIDVLQAQASEVKASLSSLRQDHARIVQTPEMYNGNLNSGDDWTKVFQEMIDNEVTLIGLKASKIYVVDSLFVYRPLKFFSIDGAAGTNGRANLRLRANSSDHMFIVEASQNAYLELGSDLYIDGNKDNQTAERDVIHIADSSSKVLMRSFRSDGVFINNAKRHGIYGGNNRINGLLGPQTLVENSGQHNLLLYQNTDWQGLRAYFGNSGKSSVVASGGQAHNFSVCDSYGAGRSNDDDDCHGWHIKDDCASFFLSSGQTGPDNRGNGVRIDSLGGQKHFIIDGVEFRSNSAKGDGVFSDVYTNHHGTKVIGCSHNTNGGTRPSYLVEVADSVVGGVDFIGCSYDGGSFISSVTNDRTKLNEISSRAIYLNRGQKVEFNQASPGADPIVVSHGVDHSLFELAAGGQMKWGDGLAEADVQLIRDAAHVLRLASGDSFMIAGGFGMHPLDSEPKTRWEGMLVLADRVNWDPRSLQSGGAYWIWWTGSEWKLPHEQG